ncbi:hypothetical protein [Lishizhenia sp.]|uniref:toxin-antitoxin system YwqK family antitoxin n=1 Tax=Lishizhenia sp. TaxID=2497594 RepID=UPI00299DC3A1|nr:hypothetical protein [Lishizhenia sp.]MDX1446317.1 hypothetical protein [Lishizhenia sp.]
MRITVFALLLITLFSCQDDSLTYGEAKSKLMLGEFEVYENLASCDCDSLVKNGQGEYLMADTLYTGTCYSYYANEPEKILEAKQIFKGRLHGAYIVYSPSGDTLEFTLYKDGRYLGQTKANAFECNCDSLKVVDPEASIQQKTLYGFNYNGACIRYYPNSDSIIYMRENYKDGYLDGSYFVYDREGNIISEQKYKEGELQ